MMKLGQIIRELRQRDGKTQDALASDLGVTSQAVSRWEKGICYPDMEMIPSIAHYFGVSIDELFGYDNDRSAKIDALAEQINQMIQRNNGIDVCMDECIALAREALVEFPGNEKLSLALASALYTAGYVRYGEDHLEDPEGYLVYDVEKHRKYAEWQEAIRIYEKLLQSLNSGELRQRAVMELSQLYKNTGEHEKALRLAESAPPVTASRPFLRIKAFDGRAEVAASGEALTDMLLHCTELIQSIVWTDRQMSPRTAADILLSAIRMVDLVFTDHDYGKYGAWLSCLHMLRSYYLWHADEPDAAFGALDQALELAGSYDQLRADSPEYHTSPLLHNVRIHAETLPEHCRFRAELPDVWPWWDVSDREKILPELQADPRWDEWVRKAKGCRD